MRNDSALDVDHARSVLSYDPDSGKLFWVSDKRVGFNESALMHKAGDEAGTQRKKDGRVVVRVNGRLHLRYRIAWLIFYGVSPDCEIDHIDGDGTNDRISNLRLASRRVNQENIRGALSGKRSSGFLGVYSNKPGRSKPWIASISSNGKQNYLGAFSTEEDAYDAYIKAKRMLHEGCTI